MPTYPSHFSQLCQHDNYGGVVLPQHSPEILGGLGEGPLRADIGLAVTVALLMGRRKCHYVNNMAVSRSSLHQFWSAKMGLEFHTALKQNMNCKALFVQACIYYISMGKRKCEVTF